MRLATLVLLLCSINTANASMTWRTEDGGNGHAYWQSRHSSTNAFPPKNDLIVTYAQAKAQAETMTPPVGFGPGHLVSISNYQEQLFLVLGGVITQGPWYFWMGFSDEAVEGEWRWTDGTPGIWQSPLSFANPIQTAWTNWHNSGPTGESYDYTVSMVDSGPITPENPRGQDAHWLWQLPTMKATYLVEWEPLPPLPGDVNADWLVNAFDINLIADHWKEAGPLGDADFDGLVNIFDINVVSANWTVTQPVPEPATVVLALLGVGCLLARRYRFTGA